MDLCREKGVISFERTESGYKMLFGPKPASAAELAAAKAKGGDDRAAKREHYNNLLGRPHTDAELDMLP